MFSAMIREKKIEKIKIASINYTLIEKWCDIPGQAYSETKRN
jgi:hypothetical protein